MSQNKRKPRTNSIMDESFSFKQRRSSLQVNLSCVSKLTDSGNGSLRQTDVDNNDNTALNIMDPDTSLKSNRYRYSKSKQASNDIEHRSYNGIPLKNVSIVLRKINSDDEILNKNCEELKQAIMTKTMQMFDIQNEVSVKTHTALGVDYTEEEEKAEDLNQSIGSTPKDQCESESIKEQKKQYKLRKRRLFNVNNSKCYSNNLCPVQSKNEIQSSSIVLAGSNKKSDTLNLTSNTSCELIDPCETKSHRTNHSVTLNTSEDESEFTAVPIGCSTMINDQILDAEDDIGPQIANNLSSSLDKCTKKSIVSMEITNVYERFGQCDNQSVQTITGNSGNTVQTSLNVNMSIEALNEDNRHRQEKDIHPSVSEETQESINTVHTSLQMNTSLDTSNRLCLRRSNNKSRMSISNDTMNKKEGTKESIVTAKDMSLTDQLKNVFIQCNAKDNIPNDQHVESNEVCIEGDQANSTSTGQRVIDKISDGQSYIQATPYPMSRSVLLRSQLKQNANNNLHNDKNKSANATDTNSFKTKFHSLGQKVLMECSNSDNGQERSVNDTIILNNSSSCKMPSTRSQPSVIINESLNESNLENVKNTENSIKPLPKRKCKKKLLPLHECSQLLTFSPLEEERLLPKRLTFTKRRKKGKKQATKTKFNTASTLKHIEEENSNQSLLGDDIHSSFDKKKQKAKKPKKVVSKKIIVKKIVNEDILKRLEENGGNVNKSQMVTCVLSTSSTNDFQSLKRLSTTQLSKRKAQRINIVATGLSNDDKNIVKSVIRALGLARLELNVTKRTTHVVTTGVRTINLLHGIIRGCWLVSLEWVLQSLENNAWLDPEKYEMTHFSKAALENRKDRQLFGRAYVPELFATCGYIYVGKETTPPCNILKDLIKTAGGFITESLETAKIIIGAEGVKETWVLDCITTGELQSYNQYQRH